MSVYTEKILALHYELLLWVDQWPTPEPGTDLKRKELRRELLLHSALDIIGSERGWTE